MADNPSPPHVQSKLVVTVVMKVAECVCVSVTVSAGIVLVMSVSTTAGPTTTSLLLVKLCDIVDALRRVAVTVRDIVLVMVSVESLNDAVNRLYDDAVYLLCDDPRGIVPLRGIFVPYAHVNVEQVDRTAEVLAVVTASPIVVVLWRCHQTSGQPLRVDRVPDNVTIRWQSQASATLTCPFGNVEVQVDQL